MNKDMFEEVDGRWTCTECGYAYSAGISDDQVPTICECVEYNENKEDL